MTEYIKITANAQNFYIVAPERERTDDSSSIVLADNTYISRTGDTYISRTGDTYVAHNLTTGIYPFVIQDKKRSFRINAPEREKT